MLAGLAAHSAPGLILSDIQLVDGLSFEIWEQAVVPSPVVLTTACDACALRACAANSVAYLLKPVKLAEFALPRPQRPHKIRFLVRQGELLPLPVAEAAWFGSRHYTATLVVADGRRFSIDYTLGQLEGLLDPAQFFRLNRQLIAQLQAVRRLVPHFGCWWSCTPPPPKRCW